MHKLSRQLISIFVATALIILSGIAVFAQSDFEHMRGGYGFWSGVDQCIAVWHLDICSSYASASGYILTNRATGIVAVGAQASDVWADNSGSNSCTCTVYGNGQYGEIFFDAISISSGSCQYNQIGYGSASGSDSQTSWSLSVSSSGSSSSGSVALGYAGNVYCYTDVNNSTSYSSTALNTNSLTTSGDGYASGITFSNVHASPVHINFTFSEELMNYGYKAGVQQQAHWLLSISSSSAHSAGFIDSGYTGMITCYIFVNNTMISTSAADANSLTSAGEGSWAAIYFS